MSSQLIPGTFKQRGVHIPFTTPALRFCRVRTGRNDEVAEVMIPNISSGRGHYVVDMPQLDFSFSLTVHDRMLKEKLGRGLMAPHLVRQKVLEVSSTGIAGAGARLKAVKIMQEDQVQHLMTFFYLLKGTVQQMASKKDLEKFDLNVLASPKGRDIAIRLIRNAAAVLGLAPKDVLDRVEKWSNYVAPVGSPDGNYSGYIRRAVADLDWMASYLRSWSRGEHHEISELAERFAMAADTTATYVRHLDGELTGKAADIGMAVVDWDVTPKYLQERVEKMAWAVDGWDQIIQTWREADRQNRQLLRDILIDTFRVMPVLPREASGDLVNMWQNIQNEQKRWVNAYESWLTGDIIGTNPGPSW